MRPQLPFKPRPASGRMRTIKMRQLPKKSLPPVLLFVRAFRNADMGLGSELAFPEGVRAYSIAPEARWL